MRCACLHCGAELDHRGLPGVDVVCSGCAGEPPPPPTLDEEFTVERTNPSAEPRGAEVRLAVPLPWHRRDVERITSLLQRACDSLDAINASLDHHLAATRAMLRPPGVPTKKDPR